MNTSTTRPKKVPIKKLHSTGFVYRGKWTPVLHTNDSEGGRMQELEVAYIKGKNHGIHHESKKKSLYRAQGAFFGTCITGIIIIIALIV